MFDFKQKIIKAAIPMIKEYLPMFDPAIAEYRQMWVEKNKLEEGEDISCMIFQQDGKTFISFVILTQENAIRAQLETLSFSDFVMKLLEMYQNKTGNATN